MRGRRTDPITAAIIAVPNDQLRRRRRIANAETHEYDFNSLGMQIDVKV
jgi:hypothetical protein